MDPGGSYNVLKDVSQEHFRDTKFSKAATDE